MKNDRLDGDRLLTKLMRHHTGERGGWSVVRVPSPEEEDARHLHRELERLKRERLAHRRTLIEGDSTTLPRAFGVGSGRSRPPVTLTRSSQYSSSG